LSSKIEAFASYLVPKGSTKGVAEISTDLSTLQEDIGLIDPDERPSEKQKIGVLYRVIRIYDSRFNILIS
jgi:hypothetical protein